MIHPFLLAIFPILGFFVRNTTEVPLGDLVMPIAVVFLLTLATWLFATCLLGNPLRAGLFTTLCLIPFYTGRQVPHIVDSRLTGLTAFWIRSDVHIPDRVSIVVVLAVLGLAALGLIARLKNPGLWTRMLNLFSIFLVILPVTEITRATGSVRARPQRLATAFPLAPSSQPLPDIYYIILDGYARSDVMRELFDFDNTTFLERLERKGFFIARGSNANYCQTPLSLSSSLNLEYLDDLVKGLGTNQTELRELIGRNNLAATLRPLGYKFVTFSTGFDPTDLTDTDRYLSPYEQFTGFQRLLIDQTLLWALLPETDGRDLFTQARDRTLFLLDHLPRIAADPQPTLTLAHILCPHPPFIFGADGEDISHRDDRYYLGDGDKFNGMASKPEVYVRGYRGQAVYITRRIEEVIDQILARSKVPPILILQADHGSGLRLNMQSKGKTDLRERMGILNAYYFPNRDYRGLYQDITPVNSFRVVLNTLFGARFEILPDRSNYSTWSEPYQFMDVTDAVCSPSRQEPRQSASGDSPSKQ